MKRWLESIWYRTAPPPAWLLPFSALFGAIANYIACKRKAAAIHLPVPVIVVGNIAVGGTGKTPFVIWLIGELRALGWRPGVISRGYGGRAPAYPLQVTESTDPGWSGDEPALTVRLTGVPIAVAPDRVAAAQLLLSGGEVDILIADDGMQHYRLARDIELCIVDGKRGNGNGALLPAGPLREPPSRLDSASLVVVNGALQATLTTTTPKVEMQIVLDEAHTLDGQETRPLASFLGTRVHAVAGIGNPARFFDGLRTHGLDVIEHPFPDHFPFAPVDLCFDDALPVLMTEKDAVKCGELGMSRLWAVPVRVQLGADDTARVRELLSTLKR